MKRIFLLLFIFPLKSVHSQDVYIPPDQLSWSNFKGTPVAKTDPHGKTRDFDAFTWSKILVFIPGREIPGSAAKVDVRFCQDTSFVKQSFLRKKKEITDQIFQHELYHYKISILYGKKLLNHLRGLPSITPESIRSLHQAYLKQAAEDQKRYDDETKHGLDIENHIVWVTQINNELAMLAGILLASEEASAGSSQK